MPEASWFFRDKGHVRGPFSKDQLIQMFHRGQLTRFHEISQDRANWIKASVLLDRSGESVLPPENYPPIADPQFGPGGPSPWPPNPPYDPSNPYAPPGPYENPGYPITPMPPSYLVQAILVTLFCCLPIGIVAIIKSSQVSSAFTLGNLELAQKKSKEASKWVIIAVVSGLIYLMVVMVIMVLMMNSGVR